ncbi:MAG: nucleotide exchange factor GrpE [Pseudomonadota bacterium]
MMQDDKKPADESARDTAAPQAEKDTATESAAEMAAETSTPADATGAAEAKAEAGATETGEPADTAAGAASEGEPGADPAGPAAEAEAAPGLADQIDELLAGLGTEENPAPGVPDPAAIAAAEIAALEAERDELKDRLMRALAEAENTRRRAERDRKDAEAYGGTRLARDLLSVYDNIERAMANADEGLKQNHAAFLEGVELTGRELLNAFAKHKIEKHTPEKGDKFDPNLHQAMFEAPIPGADPGTVIEVMQPGFTIAGRLLRPALVGVARAG